jgi:glucose-6-phosphate dehydrogenase assembly protein OpcA
VEDGGNEVEGVEQAVHVAGGAVLAGQAAVLRLGRQARRKAVKRQAGRQAGRQKAGTAIIDAEVRAMGEASASKEVLCMLKGTTATEAVLLC